ncbi:hypothetical protein COCMIDRAFT_99641, partial [Bipolaris oryzae ATCC 44560]
IHLHVWKNGRVAIIAHVRATHDHHSRLLDYMSRGRAEKERRAEICRQPFIVDARARA